MDSRPAVAVPISGGGFLFGAECKRCDAQVRDCCPPIEPVCLRQNSFPRRVGVILPLSGNLAHVGKSLKDGFNLAAEYINDRRKIEGIPFLEVIYKDDGGTQEKASEVVDAFVSIGAFAILDGTPSPIALPLSEKLNKQGIPHIVTNAVTDAITGEKREWVFRVNPSISLFWTPLKSFMDMEEVVKDIKSIGVFAFERWIPGDWFQSMRVWFEEKGIAVSIQPLPVDHTAIAAVVTEDLLRKSDAVFIIAPAQHTISSLKAVRQIISKAGYTPKMISILDGYLDLEIIQKEVGEGVNTVFVTGPWPGDPNSEAFKSFEQSFRSRFSRSPQVRESIAYSTLLILDDALKRSARTTLQTQKPYTYGDLRTALSTTELRTPFGLITFESFDGFTNQTPSVKNHQVVLRQWQEGKLYAVWPSDIAEKPPVYPGK